MEMINECSTLIVIYFYMLMCDSIYDANQRDNYIGLAHIGVTLSMLLLNVALILRSFGKETIPGIWSWFIQRKNKFMLKGVLKEWIQEKRDRFEKDVTNYVAEKQFMEIKDYIKLTQWKIKLNGRQEELDKQKAWLERHALD